MKKSGNIWLFWENVEKNEDIWLFGNMLEKNGVLASFLVFIQDNEFTLVISVVIT